jgi:NADH:ubiquinone oxidoreductase subunit E
MSERIASVKELTELRDTLRDDDARRAAAGHKTIRLCLGTACYVRGGKQVLAALKDLLRIEVGETSSDRLFSLDVGRCFGACGLAPVIMIDDDVHQRVKPARLGKILDQYREPNATTDGSNGNGESEE